MADFEKGVMGEVVRVERNVFKGRDYVSARIWVPSRDDAAVMIPTPKGLTLAPELAAEVAREMLRLAEELAAAGAGR